MCVYYRELARVAVLLLHKMAQTIGMPTPVPTLYYSTSWVFTYAGDFLVAYITVTVKLRTIQFTCRNTILLRYTPTKSKVRSLGYHQSNYFKKKDYMHAHAVSLS